jgi:hypothetical protein
MFGPPYGREKLTYGQSHWVPTERIEVDANCEKAAGLIWRCVMNKSFKPLASVLALAVGALMVQGCATNMASNGKNPDITVAYKAIMNSKNQQETIAQLVADGKNADLVASVATAAGVAPAVIAAALPTIPESQLLADESAAQSDPLAYSPSAASGNRTGSTAYTGPHSLRTSF